MFKAMAITSYVISVLFLMSCENNKNSSMKAKDSSPKIEAKKVKEKKTETAQKKPSAKLAQKASEKMSKTDEFLKNCMGSLKSVKSMANYADPICQCGKDKLAKSSEKQISYSAAAIKKKDGDRLNKSPEAMFHKKIFSACLTQEMNKVVEQQNKENKKRADISKKKKAAEKAARTYAGNRKPHVIDSQVVSLSYEMKDKSKKFPSAATLWVGSWSGSNCNNLAYIEKRRNRGKMGWNKDNNQTCIITSASKNSVVNHPAMTLKITDSKKNTLKVSIPAFVDKKWKENGLLPDGGKYATSGGQNFNVLFVDSKGALFADEKLSIKIDNSKVKNSKEAPHAPKVKKTIVSEKFTDCSYLKRAVKVDPKKIYMVYSFSESFSKTKKYAELIKKGKCVSEGGDWKITLGSRIKDKGAYFESGHKSVTSKNLVFESKNPSAVKKHDYVLTGRFSDARVEEPGKSLISFGYRDEKKDLTKARSTDYFYRQNEGLGQPVVYVRKDTKGKNRSMITRFVGRTGPDIAVFGTKNMFKIKSDDAILVATPRPGEFKKGDLVLLKSSHRPFAKVVDVNQKTNQISLETIGNGHKSKRKIHEVVRLNDKVMRFLSKKGIDVPGSSNTH